MGIFSISIGNNCGIEMAPSELKKLLETISYDFLQQRFEDKERNVSIFHQQPCT